MTDIRKKFSPQKDITAYELASIVGQLAFSPLTQIAKGPVYFDPDQWEKLPQEITRHFVDCDD